MAARRTQRSTSIYDLTKKIGDFEQSTSSLNKNGENNLRYHGTWIDSVWKSLPYADALKENPINLPLMLELAPSFK